MFIKLFTWNKILDNIYLTYISNFMYVYMYCIGT